MVGLEKGVSSIEVVLEGEIFVGKRVFIEFEFELGEVGKDLGTWEDLNESGSIGVTKLLMGDPSA